MKCIRCLKEKEKEEFVKEFPDGVTQTWNVCFDCRRQFVLSKFGKLGQKKVKKKFN